MPENLKTLRRRIRSIKTTRQVTRAMEMVSAAKLRRAQNTLQNARPYAAKLQEALRHLAEAPEAAEHPLFRERAAGGRSAEPPILLALFTADRGLCGGFNANLIRLAEERLARRRNPGDQLLCAGRKGLDHFRRAGRAPLDAGLELQGRVSEEAARRLARRITELYLEGPFAAVEFVFAEFVSNAVNRPEAARLLPVRIEAAPAAAAPSLPSRPPTASSLRRAAPRYHAQAPYLFAPGPAAVLERLIPQYLYSRVFILLAESITSEHAARMLAMNNATRNCEELVDTLTLRMNKARQAAITKEITEIVGGAEALKG